MKQELFLSIIIPMYNTEKYINRCLESLNNQSDKDFEIIIIDDSSTDTSFNKADQYLKHKDLNYRIIKQDHSGQSAARNLGLSNAKGKYLLFLDSDDYIESNLVEKVKEKIKDKEAIDIVVFDHRRIRANGEEINLRNQLFDFSKEIRKGLEVLYSYKNNEIRLWTSSLIYNKEFIEKNNIKYPVGCYGAEDLNFIFKSLIKSEKILCFEDKLVVYCQRKDSLTNDGDLKRNITVIDSMEDLVEFIKMNFNDNNLIDIIKTEFIPEHIMYQIFGCTNKENAEESKKIIKQAKVKEYLKKSKLKSNRYSRNTVIWMKSIAYAPTLFINLYLKRK